jgi:hypothetical protein
MQYPFIIAKNTIDYIDKIINYLENDKYKYGLCIVCTNNENKWNNINEIYEHTSFIDNLNLYEIKTRQTNLIQYCKDNLFNKYNTHSLINRNIFKVVLIIDNNIIEEQLNRIFLINRCFCLKIIWVTDVFSNFVRQYTKTVIA